MLIAILVLQIALLLAIILSKVIQLSETEEHLRRSRNKLQKRVAELKKDIEDEKDHIRDLQMDRWLLHKILTEGAVAPILIGIDPELDRRIEKELKSTNPRGGTDALHRFSTPHTEG